MRFKKTQKYYLAGLGRERSAQRVSAAKRAVQRDLEINALCPELVKHQNADDRMDAWDDARLAMEIDERSKRATEWHKVRRMVRELPAHHRRKLLEFWNGRDSWLPGDPVYLLELVHRARGVRSRRQAKGARRNARGGLDLAQDGGVAQSAARRARTTDSNQMKERNVTKTTFTGCKHLDFETNFLSCKKQTLADGSVFWLRDVDPDLPLMVQFCKLRGRLNHPLHCLKVCHAVCRLYEAAEHTVEVED